MSEFLGSVWWLLVTLGLLVTFHEFGHFWVARRCGVKVLRFSVGFGKPVWSRFGRDGVEYAIGAIPLGGYVKMLDEREGEVAPADLDQAHNRKPVLEWDVKKSYFFVDARKVPDFPPDIPRPCWEGRQRLCAYRKKAEHCAVSRSCRRCLLELHDTIDNFDQVSISTHPSVDAFDDVLELAIVAVFEYKLVFL